jgi:NADH dehydrogenase
LPLGKLLSRIQANVLEYFPGKPFSRDNLRSASEDSVILGDSGYDLLGIQATRAGEVVPKYLGGKFERKRFYDFRAVARRIP